MNYKEATKILGEALAAEPAVINFNAAKAAFDNGQLRAAAAGFDRALSAARQTLYDTDWMRIRAAVYFRYLSELSPTLSSDMLEEAELASARSVGDDFCAYVMAKDALLHEREGELMDYLARNANTLYADHLAALRLMRSGEAKEALAAFERLLSREELGIGVLMYEILGDMELCCRQNDDYKRAYEFASTRLGLTERLLSEI